VERDIPGVGQAKRCTTCGQRFTNDAAFCPFDGEPLVEAPPTDAAVDPLIGSLIDGRYEVLDSLGEGGMGTVYRVRHRVLQRELAVKVLRKDLARERDLGERFIQEARTAATINHPNVVQITDYGQLPDSTPYFVMELLKGRPLSRLIKTGGPIPAAQAVRFVSQIAAGVGAAHRVGVVHRDLKPDNIFVLDDGGDGREQVKILDFGVAKVAGSASMTRTGMVFGSPHYMSPEQASGQPVDHRADIYALGIIMYELFTGRVPFEADTFMGVLTKHMFMAPERFSQSAGPARELGALEDITLRCLEKKRENRFPTMEALVAEIDEVVRLGSGDEMDVRPSSVGSERRPSMSSFRLADELEPPLPDEVSAARARRMGADRRSNLALVALVGAGVLFVSALGTFAWSRLVRGSPPAALSASTAVLTAAGKGAPEGATAPAAVPAALADAGDAPAAAATADGTQSPPPKEQPKKVVKVRPPPPPPPPPDTKKEKPPPGSSEIVNPWGN
jgi:serine/threonine-protein kinase